MYKLHTVASNVGSAVGSAVGSSAPMLEVVAGVPGSCQIHMGLQRAFLTGSCSVLW